MYKRHDVSEGRRIEREVFISCVIQSKISSEIKYCTIMLGDNFVNSKKEINVEYKSSNSGIMSKPCKKQYSFLLFAVCKLIAKKYYWDYDFEEKCDIEHSNIILNRKINNNYIYKLEAEVLLHNDYDMYRNVNFPSFYKNVTGKKISMTLLKRIFLNEKIFGMDCRCIFLALKMTNII